MSAETPQPHDLVRATMDVEFLYQQGLWDDDSPRYAVRLGDGSVIGLPRGATVEVLERAEDADAPILGPGTYELTKRVHVGDDGRARFMDMPDGPLAEYVAGFWPKTRSWVRKVDSQGPSVRVPNEPHGLSRETRKHIGELLIAGDLPGAQRFAGRFMDWSNVALYVSALPEYQAYLAAHGEKREPRTFPADGPEPPHDVTVLRDDATDHDDRGYLLRAEDGWCWSHRPEAIRADCGPIQSWKDAASSADGNLWEVV